MSVLDAKASESISFRDYGFRPEGLLQLPSLKLSKLRRSLLPSDFHIIPDNDRYAKVALD